jgi:hypothetical protein
MFVTHPAQEATQFTESVIAMTRLNGCTASACGRISGATAGGSEGRRRAPPSTPTSICAPCQNASRAKPSRASSRAAGCVVASGDDGSTSGVDDARDHRSGRQASSEPFYNPDAILSGLEMRDAARTRLDVRSILRRVNDKTAIIIN